MANEMFTDLPVASIANFSDIICAVQGYSSPTVLGTSTQETLQQIYNLFQQNIILSYAGNPNGNVAGNRYTLCWDTANMILYVCTLSGTASTAQWSKSITLTAGSGVTISQSGANIVISASGGSGFAYSTITGATTNMMSNNGYIVDYTGGTAGLFLPTTSDVGDQVIIMGQSAGGFVINQGAGQQITISPVQTTLGAGGSLASTNRYGSLTLVCTVANTFWQAPCGVQGIFTYV